MASPKDLRYSHEHEWVRAENGIGIIGITDYAQDQLGDIVYVDLPAVGSQLRQMEKMGEIESVKAISDLYSPVSGEVTEVNLALAEKPELVNDSPYGEGWMVRVSISNPKELDRLLSAEEYEAYIAEAQP
ncbi:MAG TPA: glycine cleavage system protein GcvH, partial [Dehalococcoidia bacterium]|nr:glycine cleavage system protein GcvH [Dehalococcoidia bacterium]